MSHKDRIAIHMKTDPELARKIREYADQHQWSMNRACLNLIRIALEAEAKSDTGKNR